MRGLTDIAGILYDECDFFALHEQENVLHLATRYSIKESQAIQVMISTPNRPGGLYERIEKDSETMFHKVYWPYQIGLGKIYSVEEVESARKQPGFSREMELAYGGALGNAFSQHLIDKALEIGKQPIYDYEHNPDPKYKQRYAYSNVASLGVDPGYGSSNFGICLTQAREEKIYVCFAEEYEKASFISMADYIVRIMNAYHNIRCYIDGSQPEFISEIKKRLNEVEDYESHISRKRRELMLPAKYPLILENYMRCIPVDFKSNHENMLSKTRAFLELAMIAIPPTTKQTEKLVLALRTAQVDENRLDKSQTTHDDCFDAFRLALQRFVVPEPSSKKK